MNSSVIRYCKVNFKGNRAKKTRKDKKMEEKNKRITLAEFLGWEEDRAYKCSYGTYKIIDGILFLQNPFTGDWTQAERLWTNGVINNLVNAKPIF